MYITLMDQCKVDLSICDCIYVMYHILQPSQVHTPEIHQKIINSSPDTLNPYSVCFFKTTQISTYVVRII